MILKGRKYLTAHDRFERNKVLNLKYYACSKGVSREECNKTCNNPCPFLHHDLAYTVKAWVDSGKIKVNRKETGEMNILFRGS